MREGVGVGESYLSSHLSCLPAPYMRQGGRKRERKVKKEFLVGTIMHVARLGNNSKEK